MSREPYKSLGRSALLDWNKFLNLQLVGSVKSGYPTWALIVQKYGCSQITRRFVSVQLYRGWNKSTCTDVLLFQAKCVRHNYSNDVIGKLLSNQVGGMLYRNCLHQSFVCLFVCSGCWLVSAPLLITRKSLSRNS